MNHMFLLPTTLIVYNYNHGNITELMDNTKALLRNVQSGYTAL